jgi:hypothetical protein
MPDRKTIAVVGGRPRHVPDLVAALQPSFNVAEVASTSYEQLASIRPNLALVYEHLEAPHDPPNGLTLDTIAEDLTLRDRVMAYANANAIPFALFGPKTHGKDLVHAAVHASQSNALAYMPLWPPVTPARADYVRGFVRSLLENKELPVFPG